MAIYEKSTADLLREYAAQHPNKEGFHLPEILEWFQTQYPKIKRSTVEAHVQRFTTNYPSRIHRNVKHPADDVFFREPSGRLVRFDAAVHPAPITKDGPRQVVDSGEQGEGTAAEAVAQAFAAEAHLRDFLKSNLDRLEPGLRLYVDDEGTEGVEFPIRSRFIDVLALGRDGALVVVELKLSRGTYAAVGQVLTYMGFVRADLADGAPVRGILVAQEITDETRAAIRESRADIKLFEYQLEFSVRDASSEAQ